MAIYELEDNGNKFRFDIQKMPATKAEAFLWRLVLMAGKNVDFVTTEFDVGEIIKGLFSCKWDDAKSLLDELLFCCYKLDGNNSERVDYDTVDGYLSSPISIFKLRMESFKLNFAFLLKQKNFISPAVESIFTTAQKSGGSQDTQI